MRINKSLSREPEKTPLAVWQSWNCRTLTSRWIVCQYKCFLFYTLSIGALCFEGDTFLENWDTNKNESKNDKNLCTPSSAVESVSSAWRGFILQRLQSSSKLNEVHSSNDKPANVSFCYGHTKQHAASQHRCYVFESLANYNSNCYGAYSPSLTLMWPIFILAIVSMHVSGTLPIMWQCVEDVSRFSTKTYFSIKQDCKIDHLVHNEGFLKPRQPNFSSKRKMATGNHIVTDTQI